MGATKARVGGATWRVVPRTRALVCRERGGCRWEGRPVRFVIDTRRPEAIALVGFGGLALLIWLMEMKPF